MKQLLQNMKTGKTTVEEIPIPTPHSGQALVRVAASLVSAGTERMLVEFGEKSLLGKARSRPDLVRQVVDKMKRDGVLPTVQAAFNRLDQPIPLGYSSAGVIVSVGDSMEGFKVGQRVACAGGGFAVHAEYNLIPHNLLTLLPDGVDFESAAFTTLGAIALHGFRLAEPQLGENVAVIGMGLLGILAAQIAVASGCHVLGIDTNPERVALAVSLGLNACQREQAVESAQTFTGSTGFDVVLICADTTSNDPVELAAVIARDRAHIVATGAVGLTFPRKTYFEKELSFVNSRSYGPGRYDPAYEEHGDDYPIGYVRWTEGRNFKAVVDLLAGHKLKVKDLITHRFPIERAAEAYAIITGKEQQPFLGILLTYSSKEEERPEKVVFTTIHRPAQVVRLGVLGAGLFANATLLPAIQKIPGIELVGIASAAGLHAQHAAQKFGFAYAASSADEIIQDPEINTLAILTRHDSHSELVLKGLQAGKHVFVEKPLAIDKDGLDKVIAALAMDGGRQVETGRLESSVKGLLTVGFNRRFAPLAGLLAAHFAQRAEALYMHYRINAGFIPLSHWTHDPGQGGGRVIGEGCHFVDFLTFLAGAAPVSVGAIALPDVGKYHADNISMTFTFPDGSIGVVDYLANGDKSLPKERIEVFCGGRVAVLDDFRSLELIRDGRRTVTRKAQNKGWVDEWVAFEDAIRSGGEAPIPYEQLIGVTKATFAAVESLRAGKTILV
jgi:predicted dehydrogenase/threonine dehydrogenase-like Zn-dependent dehydrogenase